MLNQLMSGPSPGLNYPEDRSLYCLNHKYITFVWAVGMSIVRQGLTGVRGIYQTEEFLL